MAGPSDRVSTLEPLATDSPESIGTSPLNVPSAPSSLIAVALAATEVELTWIDNSFNETTFKVRRKGPADTDFVEIASLPVNATRYVDSTTQANTAYTYRVRAVNSDGGNASNDATVTTPPALAAPTNLQAVADALGRVSLSWLDNSTNEDGFKVRRKRPADTDFADVATVGANVRNYLDASVQPSTTYVYRVRAFRNAGGGAFSNDAIITTPPPVTMPAPRIVSVAPPRGPLAGGTPITVAGENFKTGCQVRLGGLEAQNVVVAANGLSLTARTPAQAMAGKVALRVVNPDQQNASLPDAFQYDGPPMISGVSPNSGPAELPAGAPLQMATVLGAAFQPGATVMFGDKPAQVLAAAIDKIEVLVPSPAPRGAVAVKVRNPDGQQVTAANAFSYLGPMQQARPRINSVNVTTVLDNSTTPIVLKGFNLKRAFDQGLIVVRAPASGVATVRVRNGAAVAGSGGSLEDTVTFNLEVAVGGAGLGLAEQLPLVIGVSLRPNADKDLLLEGKGALLTVVSNTLPVPLGFTAKLVNGGTNLVMMVGRNLTNTRLEVRQSGARLELDGLRASEQVVFGFVQIDAGSAPLDLRLIDTRTNLEVGQPQILQRVDLEPTTNAVGANAAPVGDLDFSLKPYGKRRPIGQTGAGMVAINVRTGANLPVGTSNASSPFLKSGVGIQVVNNDFEIDLFSGSVIVPAFGRPRDGSIDLRPVNVGVGLIFAVQALSLVLFVQVVLVVQQRVGVIPVLNPFVDIDLPEPFNDFIGGLDSPFNGFPCALLFLVRTEVDLSALLLFLLGLVKPPVAGQSQYQVLASSGLMVSVGSQGFSFEGTKLSARINSVRPLGGSANNKVRHLPTTNPVADAAGFRAFYFAQESGKACLPFQFDVTLFRQFAASSNQEQFNFQTQLCLPVNASDDLRDFTIVPGELNLAPNQSATVLARDDRGNTLKVDNEVSFELVPGSPALVTVTNQDAAENALVTAGPNGGPTKIQALVATKAGGFRFLPSPSLSFVIDSLVAQGKNPRVKKEAPVKVAPPMPTEDPALREITPIGLVLGAQKAAVRILGRNLGDGPFQVSVSGAGVSVAKIVPDEDIADTINCEITVAPGAPSGERKLRVALANGKSAEMSFYVQVPKKLRRAPFGDIDTTDLPAALPAEAETGVSVVRPASSSMPPEFLGGGAVLTSGQACGAYRNLYYQVLDELGKDLTNLDRNRQPVQVDTGSEKVTTMLIDEEICNGAVPASLFTDIKSLPLESGRFQDIIALFGPPGQCPKAGAKSIVRQNFVVKVGSLRYPLDNAVDISTLVGTNGSYTINVPLVAITGSDPTKAPGPKLTSISPNPAAVGQSVTLIGENFGCVKSVLFPRMKAPLENETHEFNVVSPTQIVAVVPGIPTDESDRTVDGKLKVRTASDYAEIDFKLLQNSGPAAPVNLTGQAGRQGIVLAWQAGGPGATAFRVERKSGTETFRAIRDVTTNTYTDLAVTPLIRYTYRVKALAGGVESAPSNEVVVQSRSGVTPR